MDKPSFQTDHCSLLLLDSLTLLDCYNKGWSHVAAFSMAAAPDMSMRAESSTPSEVDNDNDNDNDHFFNAAPGVKRANSNDSERQDENMNILASASASRPYTATTSAAHARSSSTTKTSHKRIRTQAPAPPQGIKRTGAPIRRLSDIQTTTEQQQLSDSDTSFSRRPPPKKRVRSVAPPPATASYGTTASTSRSHHVRGESVPTLDERAVTLPRKVGVFLSLPNLVNSSSELADIGRTPLLRNQERSLLDLFDMPTQLLAPSISPLSQTSIHR